MFLRFYDGACPGKKRPLNDDEKKQRAREYEAKRPARSFQQSWLHGRDWLEYDQTLDQMFCRVCKSVKGDGTPTTNTFITGCKNFRSSAISDHENSKPHKHAVLMSSSKPCTASEISKSQGVAALKMLQSAEIHRLSHLFRNAHAVAKQNRPISDYVWLCETDKAKKLDIGSTYINDHAAVQFIHFIAKGEHSKTVKICNGAHFLSFMMDGTTDISGSEQETLYIRTSSKGSIIERFLNMSSPKSTKSEDLFNHVVEIFDQSKIEKEKLIGMGSDGASNMTGARAGLAALFRQRVNPEMVNVHCLSNRLELAFRDVFKKNNHYIKLMTLLIGLHYFYKKSHNNKSELEAAIKTMNKGVLPPKVTGTRWLPHLFRGIGAMMKTFKAFEAQLATCSHHNAKAEGLYKLLTDINVVAFCLFLSDALEQVMRLSLRLQSSDVTLSDSLCWVESTIELLREKKGRKPDDLIKVLETKTFEDIKLKGCPSNMGYADEIIDGFINAIESRFQTNSTNVYNATKILHFESWPLTNLQDFGDDSIKLVCDHFKDSLKRVNRNMTTSDVLSEWKILKKLIQKRFEDVSTLDWETVLTMSSGLDNITLVIDLLLSLPPTSVKCETAFSQLKLLKTCRRSKLSSNVLQDLMTVKLLSKPICHFDPTEAINEWMAQPVIGRRTTYTRTKKDNQTQPNTTSPTSTIVTQEPVPAENEENADDIITLDGDIEPNYEHSENFEHIVETQISQNYQTLQDRIESMCDPKDDFDDDEDCFDFQDEITNFELLLQYMRE